MIPGVGGAIGVALKNALFTVDLPAQVNVNMVRWLRMRPLLVIAWVALFVMSIVLMNYSNYGSLLFVVLILAAIGYWYRVWKFFWYGCLTPAVVVSEQPTLIAALSDLGQGSRSYPAIKIQQLKRSTAERLPLGQRVTTVASYVMALHGSKWADFTPIPLDWAIGDAARLETAGARIPVGRWRLLDEALKSLPQPLGPGLYELDPAQFTTQLASNTLVPPMVGGGTRNSSAGRYVALAMLLVVALGIGWYYLADPYGRAVQQGDWATKAGQYAQAITTYSNAIGREPDNPLAYFHRAVAYQRSAEHLKAQADFDEVLRLRPDFGPAYRLRAMTLQALRLLDKAEADVAQADRLGAPKAIPDPFNLEW